MDLVKSLLRPNEMMALVICKIVGKRIKVNSRANLRACYNFLDTTSRSFAAVIHKLDDEIRDSICIFYLVLRALDTLEDDMTIEKNEKYSMLIEFSTFLGNPSWRYLKSNEKDKIVVEEFPTISSEFLRLKVPYQKVITDICRRMGQGMAEFLETSPQTLEQWDKYCHYVAGLVGIGLSEIFVISGLEDSIVAENTRSNSMGLFLQKTNIIRDYLEDLNQGRHFWPDSVWKKYATNFIDFSKTENSKNAVRCLNHLITDALQHAQDVIAYLSNLQNCSIFAFCAIPQVMAIATLERCYDNTSVFKGAVKIRRGEAAYLINQAINIIEVKQTFSYYATKIRNRISARDPSAVRTLEEVESLVELCHVPTSYEGSIYQITYCIRTILYILLAVAVCYLWKLTFSSNL